MELDFVEIGKRIKSLRESRNLSQEELASAAGSNLYQTSLSKTERGEQPLTAEQYANIADYFGITIDELLGRKTEMTIREVCKLLLQIYNSRYGFQFGKMPTEYGTVICMYYFPPDKTKRPDFGATYSEISNSAADIYDFLSALERFSNLLRDEQISREDYDYLIEKYLNDVPDENADPQKIIEEYLSKN